MSGNSGASVDINVNPDISQADLVEITDAIQRAVSNGVVNGTQSGLERARVDIQAGMDKTSGSRNPKSSFIAGSGNTGQAMKASQGSGVCWGTRYRWHNNVWCWILKFRY